MLLYKYCDQAGIGILRSRTIWLSRPRAFNDPFDVNPHIDKFDEPIRMGAYDFQKTNDIVVLSLAENCKSLLMWAHYAEHHRGCLIGFNGGGRMLDDGLVARLPLDAMSYCHHRPSADRLKHLSDQKLSGGEEAPAADKAASVGGGGRHRRPIRPLPLTRHTPLILPIVTNWATRPTRFSW